jgi:hypothetical protein
MYSLKVRVAFIQRFGETQKREEASTKLEKEKVRTILVGHF